MSTIAGLPAHILLVHAVVVFIPLTASLEILCAVWPAARRRLVWLVLAFAVFTMVITPITVDAGEWLMHQKANPPAVLREHAEWGEKMPYVAAALLVVAIALAVMHVLEGRSERRRTAAAVIVAIVALLVGVGSIVGVVRTGHLGSEAAWGDG